MAFRPQRVNASLMILGRCIDTIRLNQKKRCVCVSVCLSGSVCKFVYSSTCIYACLISYLHQRKGDLRIVPFRESKLTQLSQNFFVGKGHCAGQGHVILLVTVSPAPSVFDETLQVLKFSVLASQVMMKYKYTLPLQ